MFYSILFPTREQHEKPRRNNLPACFKDLNLDQVITSILKTIEAYGLESVFYSALDDQEIIVYRQQVMQELEDGALRSLISDFSRAMCDLGRNMKTIHSFLAARGDWRNNFLTRGQMLDCAEKYCREISALSEGFSTLRLRSVGLRGFREHLTAYYMSERYRRLYARIKHLREGFSEVRYCMLIKNGTIRVRKYEGQADHSNEILKSFEKFRQGDVRDYRRRVIQEPYADHVEAAVLDILAGLYKGVFAELNEFCTEYLDFIDQTIMRFSREIQFYLAWLGFLEPLRSSKLPFCYPTMNHTAEYLCVLEGFNIALACSDPERIVVNDFLMQGTERLIVVTGPNQSGKTTFARMFGQVHYLASLGLCVPGRKATLYLFDNIFTHFGREEDLSTLKGKLQDDLIRLHELLGKATERSIIIINEIFASTTLSDTIFLGNQMMNALTQLDAPAVIVTFLDELALHGTKTISMMGTVEDGDPAKTTFKVVRRLPKGIAHAMYRARKQGLAYDQICVRLKNESKFNVPKHRF